MNIESHFEGFIESLRYRGELRAAAKKALTGSESYSLTQCYDYAESLSLETNMRESVLKCMRGKDTLIRAYKEFVKYLQNQGVPVEVRFPPVPVDNSFERQMFIAKYLQDPNAKIEHLSDELWVGQRTIDDDLARLRGNTCDPIQICGKPFLIEDTRRPPRRRSGSSFPITPKKGSALF